ncbi:myb/SANT-like DNA-binding domain-containing protein 3 [Prorops nasuta]|uniref:myb/SANT-like DNA-binding domain-containing protein 3 n=1 Tax=Prorops nasuta TaxID=863751 RepID=UPI0034CF105C
MSKRSPPYSHLEKRVFLEILKKYKNVIECKSVSAVNLRDKNFAWKSITEEYNINTLIDLKRNVHQLKKFWQNLKQQTRHNLSTERQSRYRTGGGPEMPEVSIDSEVLDILPSLMITAPVIASSNFSSEQSLNVQEKVIETVKSNATKRLNTVNVDEYFENSLFEAEELEAAETRSEVILQNELDFTSSSGNLKIQKLNRTLSLKKKEMQLAEIKINHEKKLCKMKEEKERIITKLITEKLEIEIAEAKEKLKLSKFLAEKEMKNAYYE